MPPIEAVAGESAVTPGAGSDAGAGNGSTESTNFTLPSDFDSYIDEGEAIAIPPEREAPDGQADLQPVPATGVKPAPAAPVAQPQAQPTQTPPAGQQPAQPPAQTTPAAATPAAPSQGEGAAPRIYSPGELAQALGQNKATILDALAQQKFQLSPEDTQALDVDAISMLPKLMARVYFEATVNGLQQLANMVPRMVAEVANARIAESDSERAFFDEWPNIDPRNQDHIRVVTQLSNSFRHMNPRASREDAIKYVGQAATAFLGLQAPQRTTNGQVNGRSPTSPRPAAVRTPPFAPAVGGRAQPPAGTPQPAANPFEGLGMQYDDE